VATILFAALVSAPTASAWTTLAGGLQNTVVPSMLVTQAGTELVSFDSPVGGTISVSRNRGAPKVVVTGDPSANRTQLVQQPNGAIQLYFPNAQGVGRLTSTDDGETWTGPIQTQSHTLGPVMAAAVAADGTPYFAQDGTGFVNVFRGLNGDAAKNVFPRCCGYAESLAVDTTGLVQIAFFSNADPDGTFLYERLASDLSVTETTPLKPTAQHTDRVPLVSDHSGTTFLAWPPGSPATALTVVPFRDGSPAGDGVSFPGPFSGGDPHAALAVDSQDRLWTVWSKNGAVKVARSRSHGRHFGAVVTTATPGSIYQVSGAALRGEPGAIDVIVNTGSSLVEQQLPPGLSVRVFTTRTKKVLTRWAQALDDGVPVPTATFRIGGRTYRADSKGKARVQRGRGTATAPGYGSAPVRVP
jgi:hypothetical protein